ncbi:hypothetical protein AcW1_001623 [Taiwanofungus camphoratus]|nr:hypothetical protein AcW1_001623 [Antrodia cinnamomea]
MQIIGNVEATGYASVAALTSIIWDLVVHFTDEVKYVWRGRNGWFRWLYCFIPSVYLLWQKPRFLPSSPKGGLVRTFFSMATCSLSETIESVLLESVIIAVEVVLILRVYILCDRSKLFLIIILVLLFVSIATAIAASWITSSNKKYDGLCLAVAIPGTLVAVWLAPIVFETFLFAITLVKCIENLRGVGFKAQPILYVFIRDGTWAYLLALGSDTGSPSTLHYHNVFLRCLL